MPTYVDINSMYSVSPTADILCEDDIAIINGIINTLNTYADMDGISERPFIPSFYSSLILLLEEPVDTMTAFQIKIELENLIANNPRALIDNARTKVVPNSQGNGYDITLGVINRFTRKSIVTSFYYGKASD